MTITEKWNSIISDFKKNYLLKEDAVQNLWQEIFADADVFGYSKRSNEIDTWRNISIGSRERTIPDIIIRDNTINKDLFVVELKQYSLPFNQKYKEQLFSYMRLLELKVGVLICDKLYIFYRENSNTEYSIEISFTMNNTYGEKFIELFSKGCFNQECVKDFMIETEKTKLNIEQIKQNILNLDIKELLIQHYSKKYTLEEIKTSLENLNINLTFNNNPHIDLPNPQPKPIDDGDKMNKEKAIEIFNDLGYTFENKPTYAAKNKNANNYWANPNIAKLYHDWYLILNDWISKTLYLFIIPRNSIKTSQLITRNDDNHKIDLQIVYNDQSFTDRRSNISFNPYLKKEYKY